ncbi:CopG family transcriptional regulator [Leptolyngbya sp. CCNP1308]|uniref:type II toxin-antitoxin system BrnA family antitoxin n=1 Tax=Leptolyngbya sp. CCNP1308 TaxID=3110255 RepID=UPI002B1EF8E2|nr:CopG family transcriptional regulator [Leptolyngbya sp. CCNP1308]MEA5450045.1 CopG family transcriptional regulator [Leptolyngbya sp. CCNP1308]
MNAEDLDHKFDDWEDVLEYFDLSTLRQPGLEPQAIEITFPHWMVVALDKEAQQLGIQREAIIKLWLAERLDANPVVGA